MIRRVTAGLLVPLLLALVVEAGVGTASGAETSFVAGHPQLRVTVSGGCPASVATYRDVANPAGPFRRLVWVGPRAGLVCRYGPRPLAPPVNGESTSALYRATSLSRGDARRLAGVIARLSLKAPPGLMSCPADFGSVTIIAFSYRHRPDVDLWYDDSGCESLDNGHVRSSEPNNRLFYAGFEPLIGALSPSTPAASG